jgi:hypothetical protein
MHNCQEVVGHITDNVTVDANLQVIANDTPVDQLPDVMHIVTKSVIYKYWDNAEWQDKINKIIAEIDGGKWFVSMECLFKDFAYILKDRNGVQKVLARNEETNFLTKKLRQYGGEGVYQGYTIGRLLKDLTFSAHGLVNNPANPDSIISTSFNRFFDSTLSLGYITLEQLNKEQTYMPETTVAELKTFDVESHPAYKLAKAELESTKAKLDETLKKALAEKDEELDEMKAKCEKSEKDKAEAEKEFEKFKKEKAEKDEEMAEAAKAMKVNYDKVVAELDAEKKTRQSYEEATRRAKRGVALREADKNLSKAEVEKHLNDYASLNDATFAAMVNTIKNYAERAPKQIATAEQVVNDGVTKVVAKVEDDMPLGVTSESKFQTAVADIKAWYSKDKKGSK